MPAVGGILIESVPALLVTSKLGNLGGAQHAGKNLKPLLPAVGCGCYDAMRWFGFLLCAWLFSLASRATNDSSLLPGLPFSHLPSKLVLPGSRRHGFLQRPAESHYQAPSPKVTPISITPE